MAQRPKRLGAPPSDFATLRLPDVAEHGQHSRAAVIPVYLRAGAHGMWTWSDELLFETGQELMVLAPPGADWHVSVRSPERVLQLGHRDVDPDVRHRRGQASLDGQRVPVDGYRFDRLPTGPLPVTVHAANHRGTPGEPDGYLLLGGGGGQAIYSHLVHHDLFAGEPIGIAAYAYDTADGAMPQPAAARVESAAMLVHRPGAAPLELPMFDDGFHADGEAGDGVFGAVFEADRTGRHVAQVKVAGRSAEGTPFLRTTAHRIDVLERTLSLTDRVDVRVTRNGLSFGVHAEAKGRVPERVLAGAEVWARDARSRLVPVAWIGGITAMNTTEAGAVARLHLDRGWIGRSGARRAFELRNVRLQDLRTYQPLARIDRIGTSSPSLSTEMLEPVEAISKAMRLGNHPPRDRLADELGYRGGESGRLLLVHGYCSGGVWPTQDFSRFSVFQDFNQNRTHDEFAQLIAEHGAPFPSYGIVAHSQGGAAALHLYTFYWSGLDFAEGPRLIQSVGTPYQGTPLASLGSFSCGVNNDLTPAGAASWLASIPTSARQDVYYRTTSNSGGACNFLSSLLLSDPEDGVVERDRGQLAGATNIGHITGWCHTTGMSNPAQYTDTARNLEMDANAAR